MYVSVNWASIGSDNGLSLGQHQAIIWTNAGILSIKPQGTYFNEILIDIQIFSFKKMHLKNGGYLVQGIWVNKWSLTEFRRMASPWSLCYWQVCLLRAIMPHVVFQVTNVNRTGAGIYWNGRTKLGFTWTKNWYFDIPPFGSSIISIHWHF